MHDPDIDPDTDDLPDAPSAGPLTATIDGALAGSRFDAALAELFPQYSRSRLASWIKAGHATLDGAVVKPRQAVAEGEVVRVEPVIELDTRDVAEAIPVDVLLADPSFFVVNKPPGLVVHPGAGVPGGTLQNALLALDPALAGVPRAGIVHRLDKDTSGAMVVARTLTAHTALVTQLARHAVQRRYVALVKGEVIAGGTVRAALGRNARDRLKMVVREDGRPAVTHYRVRERLGGHTLLQVELETGRTHQIRVHMAHIKRPIVGDPMYGSGMRLPRGASDGLIEALRGFRRQALHAERLAFDHPVSGRAVEVDAPMPEDLASLLAHLRRDAQAAAAARPATRAR